MATPQNQDPDRITGGHRALSSDVHSKGPTCTAI